MQRLSAHAYAMNMEVSCRGYPCVYTSMLANIPLKQGQLPCLGGMGLLWGDRRATAQCDSSEHGYVRFPKPESRAMNMFICKRAFLSALACAKCEVHLRQRICRMQMPSRADERRISRIMMPIRETCFPVPQFKRQHQTRCCLTHDKSSSYFILPEATPSPASTTASLVQSMCMPLTSRNVSMTYMLMRLLPSTNAWLEISE